MLLAVPTRPPTSISALRLPTTVQFGRELASQGSNVERYEHAAEWNHPEAENREKSEYSTDDEH